MQQELKYLPNNYRQLIAQELGCSRELVRKVKKMIETEKQVMITSKVQLEVLKALKRHIDEAKEAEQLIKSQS